MAGETGNATGALEGRLEAEIGSFDFFQAVRRLQCARGDKPPIGSSQRPADDTVRFGQKPSLSFASSALARFRPATGAEPARLLVNFMGLLGPNGPMPLHVSEYVMQRQLDHDDAAARFLDVFNHRMISLLYRAWAAPRQEVNFEQDREDRFGVYIASLFGMGMAALRDRDGVDDVAKLYFAGRLAGQAKPPEGLRAILADYFGIDAAVEEFTGRWVEFPARYRCLMGQDAHTATLGSNLIVGRRVWECQQGFRLHLGPMGLADYERMLPGGKSLTRLVAWVRNYVGDELAWDVQLTLRKQEAPAARLGKVGRLGWSTWMITRPPAADAGDLVLRPFAAAATASTKYAG